VRNLIGPSMSLVAILLVAGFSNAAQAQSGTRGGYSNALPTYSSPVQPGLMQSSSFEAFHRSYQTTTAQKSQGNLLHSNCSNGSCSINSQAPTVSSRQAYPQSQILVAPGATVMQSSGVGAHSYAPGYVPPLSSPVSTYYAPVSSYSQHHNHYAPTYRSYPTSQVFYGSSCH
jgi:hypothetical protein